MRTMGQRIRLCRERRGISLAALAIEIGVRQQTVWRYEKDLAVPGSLILMKLCDSLNCSPRWLVTGVEQDEPETPHYSPNVETFLKAAKWLPDGADDILRNVFAGKAEPTDEQVRHVAVAIANELTDPNSNGSGDGENGIPGDGSDGHDTDPDPVKHRAQSAA